jgi:hypothetical protein
LSKNAHEFLQQRISKAEAIKKMNTAASTAAAAAESYNTHISALFCSALRFPILLSSCSPPHHRSRIRRRMEGKDENSSSSWSWWCAVVA